VPIERRFNNLGGLAHGEAHAFEYERGGETQMGFIMRNEADTELGWVAYRNWCPHWGVDLDMGEERFYAKKVDRIFCKNHGALFRIHDGYCDAGPCATESLERFAVRLEGGELVVTIAETVAERI
jgi:nitrite reductase/ring-hydroxylating ferredoxin subunit